MSVEIQLAKAKELIKQQQFAAAESLASNVLESECSNSEAWYVKAVAQRFQCCSEEALKSLRKLRELSRPYGRIYQEEGCNWLAQKNLSNSIAAFERATQLDSALIASWNALIDLYKMQKNQQGVGRAKIHFERLNALPKALLSISSLINDNDLKRAEFSCRAYLQKNSKDVEALRLLAKIALKLGVNDDAEILLERALSYEPDYHLARFDYVELLQVRQKFEMAFQQARQLKLTVPDDHNFRRLYANACMLVGKHSEALEYFLDLLKVDPDNARILLQCGHACKTIGQFDKSVDYYCQAYKSRPDYGDAFWSLANLKTYRFTDEEVLLASKGEASLETSTTDRCHLCFALGKAFEDRKEFGAAFEYYQRGNLIKKNDLGYNPDLTKTEMQQQIGVCTAALFERTKGQGCKAPDPIFIVGLPRAGSTLLEQILASHSQVDGTMELPNILNIVRRLNGRLNTADRAPYPDILAELPPEKLQELGRVYLKDASFHRSGAPFYIDKMPNNFRHIGLIHLILPNAKIIDARRDPMACCFSGFKQLFGEGQAYTYGLEDVGRYYRDYVELMDHWDKVIPDAVLRVNYEDVVEDLEGQVRKILRYCGLPFENSCIEFYKTDRAVQTPSAEQVRQPIYLQGIDQWRNFEEFLCPLKRALGSLGQPR